MRGGRVLVSCLGPFILLAVTPAVKVPAEGGADTALHIPIHRLGHAARACALMGFEWPAGSTQQGARQDPCSRPKVYVKVAFVEGVERYLNEDRGARTNQEWLDHISQTAVEWLRASGGEGVDVIAHEEKVFVDDMPETPEEENAFSDPVPGEYVFRLYLGLVERRDLTTYVRDPTKTDYIAQAALGAADPFGTYVGAFSVENETLEKAIGGSIGRLVERGLTDRIARYEASHGQALRDPTLTASPQSPAWVSPEPGETHAWVFARAVDCRGQTHDRTFFYYQKHPPRGTLDARNAREDYSFTASGNWNIAESQIAGGVDLRYTLETGTEPGSVPMEVFVIARGDRHVRQVVFIKVKGLLVEVKPARASLSPGQQTNVRVSLWKTSVDAEGRPQSPEPIAGRQIRVATEGLVDGAVAPSGSVTTNEQGEATLTYTAGRSDKAVKFIATYQPEGYNDHVTGSGAVKVVPPEADVELSLATDASQSGECSSWESGPPKVTITGSFTRRLHAQLNAACRLEDRRNRTDDSGEAVIVEDYVCDRPLLSFTYAGSAKSVATSSRGTTTHEWVERMADPRLADSAIRVVVWLDPATRKVKFARWEGADLPTSLEVSEAITTLRAGSQTTRRVTDTRESPPFRFYPIGTFSPQLSSAADMQRATGFDIPMVVFPVVGLPYEFGDGVQSLGGSSTGTRPARSQNSYFSIPRVCRSEASETFEIRWELFRHTK